MNKKTESKIYWPIIILFLAFGIDIILNIFLANILDAEQYGDYAVAIKVAELFAIFCLMGSSASVTRFIPSYFKDKNWSKFKGFYKNRMKIFFILCFFIIIILVIIFAVLWLLNSNESINIFFNHHPLLLAIFLIPFIGLAIILSRTLDSIKHQYIAAVTNRLAMPLLLLILTFLFTIFFEKITSVDIIFMFFIILILIITFQLLVIYAKLPSNFNKIQPKFESELWQKTSTQLLVSSLIFFAFNQTGLIMLEILHTNEANVGIFAAILTITSIIWLIRAGALYIYNPMIAPLFEKKQFDELQKIAQQSTKNITYVSLIIFILLIIFSKEILSLYGKSFEDASLELIIIALGFFIKSLSALSESLLKFSGHVIHSIKPQIYCFIMNIILCAVLIPYFGLLGAAISLLISRSLLSIWQARIVKKILNIQTFIFYI